MTMHEPSRLPVIPRPADTPQGSRLPRSRDIRSTAGLLPISRDIRLTILTVLFRMQSQPQRVRGNTMASATFDLGTFSKVPLTFVETDTNGNLVSPEVSPVVTSSDETTA